MTTFVPHLDRARVIEATGHTLALWGDGRSREDYASYILGQLELAGPELLHYAGLVDDTGLVASMKRYGLRLRGPDGRERPAVGIGAVYTRDDARGRGHAAALLREILREAREAGAAAAWLHAEIDPAYYARLGFLELSGLAHRASAAELPACEPLQLRPAGSEDMDRLLAWYDAASPPGPSLRPARWPHMWRYFVFRNGVQAWILADGGRDVGYLAASPGRGKLWVNEWSAPGVEHARILGTLRAFAEREGAPEVAGWLPPDVVGPPFQAEPRKAGVPMIALLDPAWTAAGIDPGRIHFGSFEYF